MNKLPFNVIIFDKDDEPTSRCMFPTERAARKRYEKAVISAPCANVGRVQLTRFSFPDAAEVMEEWTRETEKPMDIQTAGYIVHSARMAKFEASDLKPIIFHDNMDDAVNQARRLADKWSLGHEGLIVFKAIKHVQKVERAVTPTTKIRVLDV